MTLRPSTTCSDTNRVYGLLQSSPILAACLLAPDANTTVGSIYSTRAQIPSAAEAPSYCTVHSSESQNWRGG